MAAVWAAVHPASGTPVALKILPERSRPDWVSAFHREARAVAGLDHPNVVAVLDTGTVPEGVLALDGAPLDGAPWLAMERARGSVADMLHADRPRWPVVRQVLLSLLSGLAAAHARGLLHCDVKPSNLLIASDALGNDVVRLADFGIAHALGESLTAGDGRVRILGTRAYMAPEQLAGRWRDLGPWTDLWGVGCVAWTLLTGAPPRGRVTSAPPGAPEALGEWLVGLLEPDWRNRWARAADAAHALVRCTLDDPASAARGGGASAPVALPVAVTATAHTDAMAATRSTLAVDEVAPPLASFGAGHPVPPCPREWRAVRPSLAPRHLAGAGLGLFGLRELPLVGRDDALDALWATLTTVHARGGVVKTLVVGPSGAGRTRLLDELAARAHEVGAAEVVRAGPHDDPGSLVRGALRADGLEGDLLRAHLRGRLGQLDLGLVDGLALTATGQTRPGVVAAWLETSSVRRPVLLVLDDVDRAPSMVELVRLVGQREGLSGARIAIVGAATAPIDGWTPVWTPALGLGGAARLARAVLGLDPTLAVRLAELSGGLPKVLVEAVSTWIERGDLVDGEDGLTLRDGARAAVNDTLRARLEAVIGGRAEVSRALELACALGPEVDRARWTEGAARMGLRVELDALVSDLARAGMVREHRDTWSFRDPRALEVLPRDPEVYRIAADLADDDATAGRRLCVAGASHRAEASARLGRAADALEARGQLREAAHLLTVREAALDPDTEAAAESWARRGRLHGILGELEVAERLAARAIAAGRDKGWPRALARGLTTRAYVVQRRGRADQATSDAIEALALFRSLGDAVGTITVLRALAGVAQREARLSDAEPLLEEALDLARRLRSATGADHHPIAPGLVAAALAGLGNIAWRQGHIDVARARFAEARDMAGAIDVLVADIGWEQGILEQRAGDLARAEALYRDALTRHEALGNLEGVGDLWNSLGDLAVLHGDFDTAELHFHRALTIFDALGSQAADIVRANLGITLLDRGDLDGAAPLLERCLADCLATGRTRLLGYLYPALLPIDAARADWASWTAHLTEARRWLSIRDEVTPDHQKLLGFARDQALRADAPARAAEVDTFARTLDRRPA